MENIEKIEIKPNQFVWVDKNAEIKKGDCIYNLPNHDYLVSAFLKIPKEFGDTYKIIAASPELKLENMPSYMEWLAEKEYKKKPFWIGSGDTAILYDENKGKRNSFIKGYKTAEKELFTEQDIRKAIELARKYPSDVAGFLEEEIIEQLKQSKTQTK